MRNYDNWQIVERVQSLPTFEYIPNNYWLAGMRSILDEFNKFDDKFYLMFGTSMIKVFKGTTNSGAKGLMHFDEYNKLGVAVLKSDHISYDGYKRGISKGREVFRQHKGFPHYRDGNKNEKIEEIGEVYNDIIYAHIHDAKMDGKVEYKGFINGWSTACQVMNNGAEWDEFMDLTKDQDLLTYALLKEFNHYVSV